MKVRFDKIGYPLYCDAGPYEGDMRIDLKYQAVPVAGGVRQLRGHRKPADHTHGERRRGPPDRQHR